MGGDRRPRQHKFLLSAQLSRLQCLPPVCLLSSSFLGASWKMSIPPPPPPCYPSTPFRGWKNNFGAPRGVRAWKWRWPPAPSCQQGGKNASSGEGRGKAASCRAEGANFSPTAGAAPRFLAVRVFGPLGPAPLAPCGAGDRDSGPRPAGTPGRKLRTAGGEKFLGAACLVPAQTAACGQGFRPLS